VPIPNDENNLRESVTLRCHGRIVRGEETRVLCAVLRKKAREVILDLRDVTEIDAAGIGALVSLQAAGIYLKLLNPKPMIREVFRVTKLDSVFEIVESQAAPELGAMAQQLAAVAS
jgi:anti-anti-sigma factor